MMLVTKLTFISLATVPVLLTLAHRSATMESHDKAVIERPYDVRLDGVEALKHRMPFNDRFVAVQDQPLPPPMPEPQPVAAPDAPEPMKPHAVKVTDESTPPRVARIAHAERHRHHERDHDICRGHGRRYYYKHGWRYWHCRR
jgi:deoxyribodipyrimidine photolyase